MAHIRKYKTHDGQIRWRVRWVDFDGKEKSKSFDRQKTANDYKINLEHNMREGTYVTPSAMTVRLLLDEWIEIHQRKIEHNTIKAYKQNIKHINASLGNKQLQALRPADIEKMYSELDLSGKTLSEIHSTLNLSMKYAVKNRYITHNPCDIVDKPKKKKYQASIINPSMVSDYLKLFEDAWIYPAVILAIFTGLRRGEILALKWSDVNYKTMKINVSHSAVNIKNDLVVKATKNNMTRVVDMQPGVAIILKKYKQHQVANKMKLGGEYNDSEYLLREDDGTRPMPSLVSRFFNRRIQASKLPHVRFHDLRHTAGSLMLLEGANIKTVSEILGHSSITITADVYAHVIEEQKRKAANSIGKYLI